MAIMDSIKARAKADKKTIILPESMDNRTFKAAEAALKEGIANIIIIGTPEQIEEEFKGCVSLAMHCLTTLGLQDDVTFRMSKWDPNNSEKYLGTAEDWDRVQNAMRKILDDIGNMYLGASEEVFRGEEEQMKCLSW